MAEFYVGTVCGGVVVFDENPPVLSDGTKVWEEPIGSMVGVAVRTSPNGPRSGPY